MYSWEKSLREEKSRRNTKNPSFSSSLLDEIYRSIDGNDEKSSEELRVYREKSVKKYSCSISNGGIRTKVEDEEMASLKRACLIEKWMEKKVNDKVYSRRRPSLLPEIDNYINDPLFFSSTSSSSDSSSGGLSSSDTEFFPSSESKKSCFSTAPRPKPVRTSISGQQRYDQFDEYQNQQANKDQESLIKSKSRALKIYANLKKVKQPISPGGRLTSFINSLFTNGSTKKTKNSSTINNGGGGAYEGAHVERKSKSTQVSSTCSSASSFSRSCLSKTPPSSRGKLTDAGTKRTVRFYPVSVIVDEDCRPCGHKCIYDADSNKYGRPPLPQNLKEQKLNQVHNSTTRRKIEVVAREETNLSLRTYPNQKKDNFTIDGIIATNEAEEDYDDDNYDDDAASDSSSDLFEIDHLSFFGNNRFREELPVYETTHLDTNLAIASGLIR